MLLCSASHLSYYVFSTDPPTTHVYTLSLHDALPIFVVLLGLERAGRVDEPAARLHQRRRGLEDPRLALGVQGEVGRASPRSADHTSELQPHSGLVCRLLLEKKKQTSDMQNTPHQ